MPEGHSNRCSVPVYRYVVYMIQHWDAFCETTSVTTNVLKDTESHAGTKSFTTDVIFVVLLSTMPGFQVFLFENINLHSRQ